MPLLHGRTARGGFGLQPLRARLCGAQPGGGAAGGDAAGRAVHGGGDAEHRRRGHPLPRGGEPRPLPGDHQGVPAHHPLGRAGGRLPAAGKAGQRGAAQDHADGLCRFVPLHPADHPGHRPGGGAGRGGGQQHRLRRAGKPGGRPPRPVAGKAEAPRRPRGGHGHAAAGLERGGGHAPGGAGPPGHLPGEHPGAGQRPRPPGRLRHHRAADGRQRPARPAVRGLLGPRAVFGRRVRGAVHRRVQPVGGVLPDGDGADPGAGRPKAGGRRQPCGPAAQPRPAGLCLGRTGAGPAARPGPPHPDGAPAGAGAVQPRSRRRGGPHPAGRRPARPPRA